MRNKRRFNWYSMRGRYSLRKYHFGLASVFLGVILITGTTSAQTEDQLQSGSATETTTLSVKTAEMETSSTTEISSITTLTTEQDSSSSIVNNADSSVTLPTEKVEEEPKILVTSPVKSILFEEHDVFSDVRILKASQYKILTPTVLKQMTPEEIATLGEFDFGDFVATKELYEQLNQEQINALTVNKAYQILVRLQKDSSSPFKAATETASNKPNDGYTTSERELTRSGYTPYLDRTPGRKTLAVIELIHTGNLVDNSLPAPAEVGRQYTVSVSKNDVDREGYTRYLYITVTQNGAVLKTLTIDTTQLTLGQVIPLDRSANNSGVYSVLQVQYNQATQRPYLRIEKRIENARANYLPVYGTTVYTQTQHSVANAIPLGHWGLQMTRFLEEGTNNVLHPEFVQYGWDEYTNYTTRPISIPGYELVRTEGNENYIINSDTVEKVGNVLYKKHTTSRGTAYRKMTILDDSGNAKIETYITWAKEAGTFNSEINVDKGRIAAILPSAREFFENKERYKIYETLDLTQVEQNRRTNNGIKGIVEFIQARYKSPNGSSIAPTPAEYANAYREVTLAPFMSSNSRYNLGRTFDVSNNVYTSDDVTYYYRAKTANVFVNYKDTNGNLLKVSQNGTYVDKVTDTSNGKFGTDYHTEDHKPNTIVTQDGKTYKLAPAKTYPVGIVDSNNRLTSSAPASGKVSETDQTVTYVYEQVKGNVVVHYVDEQGNTIKEAIEDTPLSAVNTPYDTSEHKLKTIEKDGKTYVFFTVQEGSQEQGQVTEGTTAVTYVYKALGQYIPYIPDTPNGPYDPTNPGTDKPAVPYDHTPENPSDNPPLPYIPGYKPTMPLQPVNPDDPTKGYIPPSIADPNDPSKDTPVPYEKIPDVVPTPTPDSNEKPKPNPTPKPSEKQSPKRVDKVGKSLPKTGDTTAKTGLFGTAMLLSALGLLKGRRRKED